MQDRKTVVSGLLFPVLYSVPMHAKAVSTETKTVRTFAFASFLHDLGADMVFSVWPLFLTTVLGANMTIVGLIDGLGDAVVSLSQAGSGWLSDKLRRRKVFVWVGYCLGGVARIGYAISPSWPWVIPFRVLDRTGKLRGSPRDAIVSELSATTHRARNFGFLRAMDNLGAVCGILISLALVGHLGFRTMFLIATIPSLCAALLVFAFIKERRDQATIYTGLSRLSANLKLYILLSALFQLGFFSYSFLLIAANGSGSPATIPALYLLFTLVTALGSYPAGMLADRFGRKPVLFGSLLCWAAVLLILLLLPHSTSTIVIAFILYGLHNATIDTTQRTMVTELAPKEFLASTIGAFQMIIGLCAFPASFIAGALWDSFGLDWTLGFSLALTAIAAVLLLFVRETRSA